MNYIDIIVSTQVKDVTVNVLSGDIFDIDAVKVLPINEFFSIEDNDWRSQFPRSVLGQFIKRLSPSEREKFQRDIDTALNRSRSDEGKIGYPYGWTIFVKVASEQIFLTNTVKYDLQQLASEVAFPEIEEPADDEWYGRYRECFEIEAHSDKHLVYYDSFLLAIDQCIEGIIKASRDHKIENLVLPLLGAGWGRLDSSLVLRGLLAFIKSAIYKETDSSLKEINVVSPQNTLLDRQLVVYWMNESPYGTCPQCGIRHDHYHHVFIPSYQVRILQDELQIVDQRIQESFGNISSVLVERRVNLVSELEKLGIPVKAPKAQERKGGRPADKDNVWAREQIHEYSRPYQEVYQEWLERRQKHGTLSQLADPLDSFKKAILQPGKKGKKRE